MNTSRSKGLLVVKTEKPFKIAVSGKIIESNVLCCNEPTGDLGDGVAYDLIHFLQAVIFAVSQNDKIKRTAELNDDSVDDIETFFDKENPTDDEVRESGISLSVALSFQSGVVKLSDFMKVFNEIVEYGFIKSEHGETVTSGIWKSLSRDDRQRIAFEYCGFFLNPYEKLYQLGKKTAKNSIGNQTTEKGQP